MSTKIIPKYTLAFFDSIWHTGLFYKNIESDVGGKTGGKTYDIIKSMYTGNTCSIKIGKKIT